MKKILIFSIDYHPFVASEEISAIKEITDRLSENDYYLISNKFKAEHSSEEKIGNINVRRLGSAKTWDKYLYPFRAASYALILHKNINFDFVWSIGNYYSGLAALFFKYKTKIPYLLAIYNSVIENKNTKYIRFFNPFYKQIYRQPKLTQVISKRLGRYSRGLANHGELILLSSGFDNSIYKSTLTEAEISQLKIDFGIEPDEKVLMSILGLSSRDYMEDIIKSMNFLVYKLGIKAKLIVFSDFDEKRLLDLSRDQGVEDRVLFFPYSDYEKSPTCIELADVFCGPTISDGFASYFLEAMALGVPVVATKTADAPDFIIENETGLFSEENISGSIALAVEKLLKDKDFYNKISAEAKTLVMKKYSWDIIAGQMKQMFNKMLEK